MKINRFFPHIITGIITVILLLVAMLTPSLVADTIPFKVLENTGIYSSDSGFFYGLANNGFSFNGTHEFFISVLKKLAVNNTLSGLVPIFLFSLKLIAVLIFAVHSANKTKYKWTTLFCAILLPIVFCDFTNLVYFKGLHHYPLVMLSLIFIFSSFVNFYKREQAGSIGIIITAISIIFFSFIGVEQAVIGIVFSLFLIRLYKMSSSKKSSILAIFLGIAILIGNCSFVLNYKSADYNRNLYNAVFFGVAKYDSVTKIGLLKELDDFKEVYYGMMENESEYDLEENFYNKISYKDVIKYYVTHPKKAYKLINNEAKAAFYTHNNYTFTPYSTVKKLYLPSGLPFILLIAIVYFLVTLFVGKKHTKYKHFTEFLGGICIMWIISIITTTILNGNCDITHNVYTFNIIFDLLFVSAAVGGIRIMLERSEDNKTKYGITKE